MTRNRQSKSRKPRFSPPRGRSRSNQPAGETLTLKINSLGAQGDGIADHEDGPVFVAGAVPGDTVEAQIVEKRRNGRSAKLKQVTESGDARRDAECGYFERCGGCQLQMLKDDIYRAWVKDRTVAALAQHGFDGDVVAEPVITPTESRRRLALKALKPGNRLVFGFAAKSSHQIVDIDTCPIARPELVALFAPMRELLNEILPPRSSMGVHLTLAANGVDVVLEGALMLDLEMREKLVEFANKHDLAALHLRADGFLDPVAIRRTPVMDFSGHKIPLPPASFIQASAEGENALVKEVLSAVGDARKALDLFSGIGTFTLPLAEVTSVTAVEGVASSLEALKRGAGQAKGLKAVATMHRDLFRQPLLPKELKEFDMLVFDPPRAGAETQAEQIAKSNVPSVVAVSCNPNTFGRDARILVDGGYRLTKVTPVDQFLWSPHLELVGLFEKSVDE